MSTENEEHEDGEPEHVQHDDASYRVLMDGRWKLEDLYVFPHAFSQCYSFMYCFDSDLPTRDRDRINEALASYPWRGGYSYVNIYTVLFHQVPPRHRPQIKAISYASPGWLDIVLNVDVAIQVAKSVGILAGSAVAAAKAYATVMKYISQVSVERKRAKLHEMRITQGQHRTFISMCEDMAKFLGLKNVKELHERTGNPEVSLKLLAAHYRRTDQLVEFVRMVKPAYLKVTANPSLYPTYYSRLRLLPPSGELKRSGDASRPPNGPAAAPDSRRTTSGCSSMPGKLRDR